MELTNRQKKIGGVIQQDLAKILQADARNGLRGVIISVTKVVVTADLGQAKAYLSVFPSEKRDEILKSIIASTATIRHDLAQLTKHQLRRMPNLLFYGDDSLDYIENIDASLKGKDIDPIKNPDILDKRKKS